MTIPVEIISQDRRVYSGDADIVVLPGVEGEMGILPNHSPLLTLLQIGIITVRAKGEEHFFTVSGGVAEVRPDGVLILANAAEDVHEIIVQRAEDARRRAEQMLKEPGVMAKDELFAIQSLLKRSNLRIQAAKRFHKDLRGR